MRTLNEWSKECHTTAREHGFWENLTDLIIPTKLMLIVSELGEAMEAHRGNNRENFEEEIADTFIRLFDLCGWLEIDIEKAVRDKMEINSKRPYKHGKAY